MHIIVKKLFDMSIFVVVECPSINNSKFFWGGRVPLGEGGLFVVGDNIKTMKNSFYS